MSSKCCSECGAKWESENSIPEDLLLAGNYDSLEAAKEAAKWYGWTEENDKRFITGYIAIQYAYPSPHRYDGVSEYQCKTCKTRFGRWSGKILRDGEAEKVYGG